MTHCAVNVISVTDRVVERFEDDARNALTSCKTVCGRVKRLASAVLGEDAGLGILDPFVDPTQT